MTKTNYFDLLPVILPTELKGQAVGQPCDRNIDTEANEFSILILEHTLQPDSNAVEVFVPADDC